MVLNLRTIGSLEDLRKTVTYKLLNAGEKVV